MSTEESNGYEHHRRTNSMTRKSTQKYEVVHLKSMTVCLSGVSRTDATKVRQGMGSKDDFYIRPVKRA